MSGDYEHCLGCGHDVRPCEVPDRCKLLGWRHVDTGYRVCANGSTFGWAGHDEPGWVRDERTHQWRRDDGV